MIQAFIKLFAMAATVGVSCAAMALSIAIVGLWMLGLAQDLDKMALPADLWQRLALLP